MLTARTSRATNAGIVGLVLPLLAMATAAADETTLIRLNAVGYLPNAAKRASVAVPESQTAEGGRFQVLRASDGAVVFVGQLTAAALNADTREQLAAADFSPLVEPGEYRLDVAGVGQSAPFRVAAEVYREPFRTVTRGMYLWRCGTAVSSEHNGQTFGHDSCHREDAFLDHVGGGHERRPSIGGWHDAGDYNKYVVNAGVTVGAMFRAWEDFGEQINRVPLDLPERGGPLPEFLAELKWEIDWLLTMQGDDGSVYHKVSTENFGGMILPEQETAPRYFVPWGSAATADFVAITAMAARHFAPYDRAYADRCLAAARKSYEFLKAHPEYHRANQRGFTTGGYETDDWDDRLWAEAELWESTGDAEPLVAYESRLRSARSLQRPGDAPNDSPPESPRRRFGRAPTPDADADWDWGNVKNLALLTYAFSEREGRDAALVDRTRQSLIAAADAIAATAKEHSYARPLGTRYYWGCNGTVARQSLVLEAARRITGDASYRAVQLDGLSYLFGRNPYGRSFVTGLGHLPPMHPHDRRSGGDDVAAPWPGYLVGGPHPRATSWTDDQDDYRTNEIAINWNAALIYALAAQLEPAP
jgi:endoglucanase